MKPFSARSISSAIVLCAIFVCSFALMPRSAFAAGEVNLVSVTATSSNTTVTYAKLGDTVNYQLTLSDTPWIAPQINIFSLGSTTMSGSGTSYWYSTTTSSINAWSQGLITFKMSIASTTAGQTSTTTVTQANLTGSNVTYDTVVPSDPTGLSDTAFHGATSATLSSAGSSKILYTTDGSTPSCSVGIVYSSAIVISGATTFKAIGCDEAGNYSAVVTAVYTYTKSSSSSGVGSYHPPVVPAVPATPASPSSSGLASEQVTAILNVLASFGADSATIANVQAALLGTGGTTTTTGSVTSTAVQIFKANLTTGSLGSEVKMLQEFLNAHGYAVASSGPGSSGNETNKFGGLTKAALIKYQNAKGITPAVGYFGSITRAAINAEK